MYESQYISYNGKKSSDLGVYFCDPEDSLLKEPFLSGRTINEERIPGRVKSYYYGVNYDNYEFPLKFYCSEWTQAKIDEVAKWLGEPTYPSELYSSGNQDRCFFCLYSDKTPYETTHNGWSFVNFVMKANSPYKYSRERNNYYNFLTNTGTQTIVFNNLGNVNLKPQLQVTLASDSDGSFSIKNTRNNGLITSFTGLTASEEITIDCENEDVVSSIAGTYPINNMSSSSDFMEFVPGKNTIEITGKLELLITYRYVFY